tara:strand:- start:5224 stop:5508 length:285 start_codon:yes stop_codon:yes gene_type:complete
MAKAKIAWPVDIRFERDNPHVNVGTTGHVDYGKTPEMVMAEALLGAKERIKELDKLKSVLLERIKELEKVNHLKSVLLARKEDYIVRLKRPKRG